MRTFSKRCLRAGILGALVAASTIVTAPAHAEPFIYPPAEPPPPILDPTREIKERVNETRETVEEAIASDPVPTPEEPFWSGLAGTCAFQGATIEGAAASVGGTPDLTGVVCRVYDQQGVLRGGCALFLPGATATCAAPTEVVLGPPTVCWHAYAVYPWDTYEEGSCQ